MRDVSRVLRRAALVGTVLVAMVARHAAGIPALVLMIAPGIVVPLGVALALEREVDPRTRRLCRVVMYVSPIAAAAGVLGWLFAPGDPRAMAAGAVHAVSCGVVSLVGATRLWRRRGERFLPLPELAIDVGLLLVAVAGVWLLASRAGVALLGFEEPVVTFTAAHFHYAGFAAPIIIGGVGRLLAEAGAQSRLYRVAVAGVCGGVPLTALGIATTHVIEVAAAILVASGMLAAALVLVLSASRLAWPRSRVAAALFVVAGSTLLLTMTLASAFALTSSAGRGSSLHGVVPLQTMIDWHGGANALGFVLPALIALSLLSFRARHGFRATMGVAARCSDA